MKPVTWGAVNAASEAVRYTVNPQLLQIVCDRFSETTTERLNYLLDYHRAMLPGFKDLVEETEQQIESIQ